MDGMNHRDRLNAALSGRPVDRLPLSLWWHDFEHEWSAQELAGFTLAQYRKFDWDLVKVNPRATYYAEAWGARFEKTGTTQPRRLSVPYSSVDQLAAVPTLDAHAGVFEEQLDGLRHIVAAIGHEVDVVQTVFNPLTIAALIVGMTPEPFFEAAARNPAALHAGLAQIASTIAAYSVACLETGASGIFFATVDWATRNAADENFYREFGRPYDLQVLAAVRSAPVNILHVCRDNNLLDLLADYPVAAFNWDANGAGNPTLAEFGSRTTAAVMGGIDRGLVKLETPDASLAQIRRDLAGAPTTRHILAGGCAIDAFAPPANIEAIANLARGTAR